MASSFRRAGWSARVSIALLCGLAGVQAHADAPVDDTSVERGAHLARLVCSNCHIVADDQKTTALRRRTPAFREIANRPGTSEQALRHFIATTHWDEKTLPMTMPDTMLSDEERIAVVRYILSLRAHPPR